MIHIELTQLEALIATQALGYMCIDSEVNPDDRLIAREVQLKIGKDVKEQLKQPEDTNI